MFFITLYTLYTNILLNSQYYKAFYNASLRKARVEKKIRMNDEKAKNKNRILKNYNKY